MVTKKFQITRDKNPEDPESESICLWDPGIELKLYDDEVWCNKNDEDGEKGLISEYPGDENIFDIGIDEGFRLKPGEGKIIEISIKEPGESGNITLFEKTVKDTPPDCDICGKPMVYMYGGGWDNDRIVCMDTECCAEMVFPTSTIYEPEDREEEEEDSIKNIKDAFRGFQ